MKFGPNSVNTFHSIEPKGVSLVPFDLKKILKQLDEEIKKSRAAAYFDHELKYSYKAEDLKDNDNPVSFLYKV
jgi:hypothetical protein